VPRTCMKLPISAVIFPLKIPSSSPPLVESMRFNLCIILRSFFFRVAERAPRALKAKTLCGSGKDCLQPRLASLEIAGRSIARSEPCSWKHEAVVLFKAPATASFPP
jgi:hypothetical protein